MRSAGFIAAFGLILSLPVRPVQAQDQQSDQRFALHAQTTLTMQGNAPFHAIDDGPNSLHRKGELRETIDATIFVGASLWKGAEIWVDPEIDQGFGLANTTGAAGFPSGEAYKVGSASPYVRVQRAFLRQSFNLGGTTQAEPADLNQLRATHT